MVKRHDLKTRLIRTSYIVLLLSALSISSIDTPYTKRLVNLEDEIEEEANSYSATAGVISYTGEILSYEQDVAYTCEHVVNPVGVGIVFVYDDDGNLVDKVVFDDGNDDTVYYYECTIEGYLNANVNFREDTNTESEILDVGWFNNKIEYAIVDEDWAAIEYADSTTGYAFISRDYIQDCEVSYESAYGVTGDKRKSYMSYRKITSKNSRQYKIETCAYTGDYGVRMYKGRYLIAVGSYYHASVGTYVDVVLSNGTIIPCVVGDAKKNCDTNANNSVGNDGSAVEFIIAESNISSEVKQHGDLSYATEDWASTVSEIRVYDKCCF